MSLDIKTNELHDYVDLIRGKEWNETGNALYNVIKTMRLSRHDKVCGEDFSQLDFGNIPFNGIHFSLNAKYPCDFTGCKLNEWNFRSGHTSKITAVRWSCDGKYVFTGSLDGTIIMWDVTTGMLYRRILHLDHGILSFSLSKDSRTMIVCSWNEAFVWKENKGIVFSIANISTKSYPKGQAVDITQDGTKCLTVLNDNSVKLWDTHTGDCLQTFDINRYKFFHKCDVNCVAFSTDGNYFVTASRDILSICWETNTYNVKYYLEGKKTKGLIYNDDIWLYTPIALSVDQGLCLTESVHEGVIWNIKTGEKMAYLGNMQSGAFSLTGNKCMTVFYNDAEDAIVISWNMDNPQTHEVFNTHIRGSRSRHLYNFISRGISSIMYSWDEKYCLIGSNDGKAYIWRIKDGKYLQVLGGNTYSIRGFESSIDGHYCLTHLGGRVAYLWNVDSKQLVRIFEGHDDTITSMAISPDNKFCITGSIDKTVKIWSINTGECIKTINNRFFSPGLVAICSGAKYCITTEDKYVMLWRVNPTEEITSALYEYDIESGLDSSIDSISISSDGKYSIVVGADDSDMITNDNGTYKWTTIARGDAQSAYVSPDGCFYALLSKHNKRKSLEIGKTSDPFHPFEISFDNKQLHVFFTSKKGYLLTIDNKKLTLWNVNNDTIEIVLEQPLEDIPTEKLYWSQPLAYYHKYGAFALYKIDYNDQDNNLTPYYVDEFYNTIDLHIRGCVFECCVFDDISKKIIYQYGAKIELAD